MAGLFRKKKVPAKANLAGKFRVTLARDMCKACGFCINICPTNVFAWSKQVNAMGWFPVEIVDENECVGCMLCFQVCPDFCLNVVPREANDRASTVVA